MRIYTRITEFLEVKLKLKVNKEKGAVDRPWKRIKAWYGSLRIPEKATGEYPVAQS